MKTIAIALFMILASLSFAFGDEVDNALSNQATVQVRTSTRQMIQAGIDKDEAIRMTHLMLQNRFTEQEVIRAHQMIMNANGKGLPVRPIMNKAFEGMTKQIQARNIIQAMETVQNRYSTAHNYAARITQQRTHREQIQNALAQGLAAGLKEKDVQAMTDALQQRARIENMNTARLGPLAEETFVVAKDMARLGVASEAVREVLSQAIQHRYNEREMRMLSRSFTNQSKNTEMNALAMRYAEGIRGGTKAEGLGAYGTEGGGSAGQGGFGHGGSGDGGGGGGGSGSGGGDGGHR